MLADRDLPGAYKPAEPTQISKISNREEGLLHVLSRVLSGCAASWLQERHSRSCSRRLLVTLDRGTMLQCLEHPAHLHRGESEVLSSCPLSYLLRLPLPYRCLSAVLGEWGELWLFPGGKWRWAEEFCRIIPQLQQQMVAQ